MADSQAEELLRLVPENGDAIGNRSLQRELGWSADVYWTVRDGLIDGGALEKSRGKGGAVRRVRVEREQPVAEESVEAEVAQETVRLALEEHALYAPMKQVIESEWARERRVEPMAVAITASQGKRRTGGKWSRPDIVSVAVQRFAHLPGKFIEVITFEVKPSDDIDVTAVYEALAHRRAATHAYVLLHAPDPDTPEIKERIGAICEAARSHEVGVIVTTDPGDFDTWDEREVAGRVEPDPAKLDEFIATQMPEDERRIAEEVH